MGNEGERVMDKISQIRESFPGELKTLAKVKEMKDCSLGNILAQHAMEILCDRVDYRFNWAISVETAELEELINQAAEGD